MDLRADANKIFRAALRAADPTTVVVAALEERRPAWTKANRIFVVGAGKASGTMARAAEKILASKIAASCVILKDGDPTETERISLRYASHPLPDSRGVEASREIARLCAEADEGDLVLVLLSGGASSLMPLPIEGITLEAKKAATQLLLDCGADIREMNIVRKHLSAIKGGQLAKLAAPANVMALILSDVVGDDLETIGSGPTVPDSSTLADAHAVFDKFGLTGRMPSTDHETPKPGDPAFRKVENVIISSNQKTLEAAAVEAEALGYRTLILSSTIEGETRDVARMHAAIARQVREHGQPVRPPACVISGGETTVTIRGKGKGGRNQEFVLAAAIDLAGLKDIVVLSAGTDGTDGPTDAAGAIADGNTLTRSPNARSFLADNDSYSYFAELNDLIVTGATGTNVMDLRLMLIG